MKKLSLLILMSVIAFAGCKKTDDDKNPDADAVNLEVTSVSKSNHSLVVKFSGTNCPPCGGWGWAMMSDLIFGVGDAGVCMVAYGQNFVAQNYICTEATTLQDAWGATGYPHFGANGSVTTQDRSAGVYVELEKNEIYGRVNAHAAAPVVANCNVNYTIDGNNLKMKYKTKAFEATGDLYLAVYIIEDKITGYQAGHSEGANAVHKVVLRGEATANQGYGANIGAFAANEEKAGEKTIDITSFNGWNMDADHVMVYTALYKKVGTKYSFVNAALGSKK